jgi:hypothetical protein
VLDTEYGHPAQALWAGLALSGNPENGGMFCLLWLPSSKTSGKIKGKNPLLIIITITVIITREKTIHGPQQELMTQAYE